MYLVKCIYIYIYLGLGFAILLVIITTTLKIRLNTNSTISPAKIFDTVTIRYVLVWLVNTQRLLHG